MVGKAKLTVAFSLTLALTLAAVFREPGRLEWLREVTELVGFAGLTLLTPFAFPRLRLAVAIPIFVVIGAGFQLLQFIPAVPGTPSWSDFAVSAAGVILAPLALCGVVVVMVVRYLGAEAN